MVRLFMRRKTTYEPGWLSGIRIKNVKAAERICNIRLRARSEPTTFHGFGECSRDFSPVRGFQRRNKIHSSQIASRQSPQTRCPLSRIANDLQPISRVRKISLTPLQHVVSRGTLWAPAVDLGDR